MQSLLRKGADEPSMACFRLNFSAIQMKIPDTSRDWRPYPCLHVRFGAVQVGLHLGLRKNLKAHTLRSLVSVGTTGR